MLRSIRQEGIIEKSVIPSIGFESAIPFHDTCVCDGALPRIDAVESDERPELFINMVELSESTSASELVTDSWSTAASSVLFWVPISRNEGVAVTTIESTQTVFSTSCAETVAAANSANENIAALFVNSLCSI